MCGTPMLDLLGPSVITPLCPNEACPVILWDPCATIATNLANATTVDMPEEFRESGDVGPSVPADGEGPGTLDP